MADQKNEVAISFKVTKEERKRLRIAAIMQDATISELSKGFVFAGLDKMDKAASASNAKSKSTAKTTDA
ncbi:MAG: hypothetical protein ISN29_01480 [Gammaproteobacteria bacterium AqS3]|nr:hypothetical protein [Gammaproteobacteria bacterium AqS3]